MLFKILRRRWPGLVLVVILPGTFSFITKWQHVRLLTFWVHEEKSIIPIIPFRNVQFRVFKLLVLQLTWGQLLLVLLDSFLHFPACCVPLGPLACLGLLCSRLMSLRSLSRFAALLSSRRRHIVNKKWLHLHQWRAPVRTNYRLQNASRSGEKHSCDYFLANFFCCTLSSNYYLTHL